MRLFATVDPWGAELRVTPRARTELTAALAAANVEQMRASLDAQGQPLAGGVDLLDTGELQGTVLADAEGWEFTAPHAEWVEARYHFAGLAPALLEAGRVASELEEILDRDDAVELIEEG